MRSEREFWTAANLLIEQHGEGAQIYAASQVDYLVDAGDLEGKRDWMRVLRRIRELQREGPDRGEAVH